MRKGTETTGRCPKNRASRGQFPLAHAPLCGAEGQGENAPFAEVAFLLILAQKCPPRKTRRGLLRFLQGYLSALARETLRGIRMKKRSI